MASPNDEPLCFDDTQNNQPDAEKMEEFGFFDPHDIAWKLLMQDFHHDLSSAILTFTPDTDSEQDPTSFHYEVLLTIFVELVSQIAVMLSANDPECSDTFIKKQYFNLEEMREELEKIFRHVGVLLKMKCYHFATSDKKMLQKLCDKTYCRIVFKYDPQSAHYFTDNNLPDELQYHFVGNINYIKTTKMDDIYAVIIDEKSLYKISFSIVPRIAENRCAM